MQQIVCAFAVKRDVCGRRVLWPRVARNSEDIFKRTIKNRKTTSTLIIVGILMKLSPFQPHLDVEDEVLRKFQNFVTATNFLQNDLSSKAIKVCDHDAHTLHAHHSRR